MKQVLQNLKTGKTQVVDAPAPQCQPGSVLIQTHKSLVSTGTERMVVEFGRSNLLQKARQQPDKVKQVLQKIKTDGLAPTLHAVKDKLEQLIPLGYCNVGTILEVAPDITDLKPGDRVVSNGHHAEIITIKRHLCAKIPNQVDDDTASFTVISAIALQGIRLAQPTLGETFVVMGLGLVGLMTVQLLKAHGCKVIGTDFTADKIALARSFGAETIDLSSCIDPISQIQTMTQNQGVDGVIITAATDSNEPVHQAATLCRKRGRIVLVGVVGLNLSRADFYEKELTFQVSCSYGPGRYDPDYEIQGQDYPLGFVRWTENRNFTAILDLMAEQKIQTKSLVSHRFLIAEAEKAYDTLMDENPLGILLEYPLAVISSAELITRRVSLISPKPEHSSLATPDKATIGFIGAGGYANQVLIPAFKNTSAQLIAVATNSSASSFTAAQKHHIAQATTDINTVLDNPQINTIVIATRHDSHADLVVKALEKGKHVFVEKPLAITLEQLAAIETAYTTALTHKTVKLMVGFNRRFSPLSQKIKQQLQTLTAPKAFIMTVNAGFLAQDHWSQDPHVGGGRMIGEGCHFVDLLRYFADSPITDFQAQLLGNSCDTFTVNLNFANGSMGTIHYFANGNKQLSKERLEIYCQSRILLLDNFRSLLGFGWPGFKKMKLWSQEKGQKQCANAFIKAIENGQPAPIAAEEIFEVSKAVILIGEKLRQMQ